VLWSAPKIGAELDPKNNVRKNQGIGEIVLEALIFNEGKSKSLSSCWSNKPPRKSDLRVFAGRPIEPICGAIVLNLLQEIAGLFGRASKLCS
jgi:hypothetical protein